MQISDFTQTEADYLEAVCNFTPDENALFRLRLKGIPPNRGILMRSISVYSITSYHPSAI